MRDDEMIENGLACLYACARCVLKKDSIEPLESNVRKCCCVHTEVDTITSHHHRHRHHYLFVNILHSFINSFQYYIMHLSIEYRSLKCDHFNFLQHLTQRTYFVRCKHLIDHLNHVADEKIATRWR